MFEPDDLTTPVETPPSPAHEPGAGAAADTPVEPMPEPVAIVHDAAHEQAAPKDVVHEEVVHEEVAHEEAAPAPQADASADVPSEPPPTATAAEDGQPEHKKHWYVVKVQSGREDTIKDAIERRVRKENLEDSFGQIVIPVEKVTEVKVDKNGKRVPKTKERKLYPGYLMVEVEYNDKMVYLFRETSGVGDFVGSHPGNLMKPPTPMSDVEILRMLGPKGKPGAGDEAPPVPAVPKGLQPGERVHVVDGTFNGMDGTVKQILEAVSKVQVELSIFGRPVNVDFEYYQVEQA